MIRNGKLLNTTGNYETLKRSAGSRKTVCKVGMQQMRRIGTNTMSLPPLRGGYNDYRLNRRSGHHPFLESSSGRKSLEHGRSTGKNFRSALPFPTDTLCAASPNPFPIGATTAGHANRWAADYFRSRRQHPPEVGSVPWSTWCVYRNSE